MKRIALVLSLTLFAGSYGVQAETTLEKIDKSGTLVIGTRTG